MCLWELVHNAGEAVPLCPMMWSDVAGPAFGAKKKKRRGKVGKEDALPPTRMG